VSKREDLYDYIFIQLGIEIHEVFLTEAQIRNAVNKSIKKFQEYSTMTSEETYYLLSIVAGQKEYILSDAMRSVGEMLPAHNPLDIFSIERHIVDNSIFNSAYRNTAGYSLLDVYLTRSWIQQARQLLGKAMSFSFNEYSKKLTLHSTPRSNTAAIVMGYADMYDPSDDDSGIFDFPWIQEFALALAWKTLGTNLKLYSGTPLPAGLTFDADFALDIASTEMDKLELELEEKYSEPPIFFIG